MLTEAFISIIKIKMIILALTAPVEPEASPLVAQQLPAATIHATGAIVVLPTPKHGEVYAVGNMQIGQTAYVVAVSSDGDKIWIHIYSPTIKDLLGVVECRPVSVGGPGDRFEVRSWQTNRVLERC